MFGRRNHEDSPKVRYAVVGLGWIAQEAVLPAFANANENSELVALVSDDPIKLSELSQKYNVSHVYSYDTYEDCLRSGLVDAVYIALPNALHRDYSVRASNAGIHVLCEKPLANTVEDAQAMVDAANHNNTKLMTAYRLHFEEANLTAVEIVNSGAIGDPRLFSSLNVQNIESGNVRLDKEMSGGPLEDMGIYCINAARYLFQSEPLQVSAFAESSDNPRFRDVPEIVTVVMRFPEHRLAQFTCGFGEAKVSSYHVVGTLGHLKVDPAYSFSADLKHVLTIDDKATEQKFSKRDQFAPLLVRFSDAVLNNEPSEPSGREGLVDVQIIEAIRQSIDTGQAVRLNIPFRDYRPTLSQNIQKRAVRKPELIHAQGANAEKSR